MHNWAGNPVADRGSWLSAFRYHGRPALLRGFSAVSRARRGCARQLHWASVRCLSVRNKGVLDMRRLVASVSPFAPSIGMSRAVRVGSWLVVAGTAPITVEGGVACPGDVYGQTRTTPRLAPIAIEFICL